MKPARALFAISTLMLAVFACHESKEVSANIPSPYRKDIGEAIPYSVAKRWVAHYAGQSSSARQSGRYSITAQNLEALISNAASDLGVAVHHGLDENGNHHVMLLPVSGSGRLWSSSTVVDTNVDQLIDLAQAQSWASNYATVHPEEPWYHFFGMDVFQEIASKPSFAAMEVHPAVNDDGEPQLLLFVWKEGAGNARTNDETEPDVYDKSNRCPPCDGID